MIFNWTNSNDVSQPTVVEADTTDYSYRTIDPVASIKHETTVRFQSYNPNSE